MLTPLGLNSVTRKNEPAEGPRVFWLRLAGTRREENVPELRRRSGELDGNERTLGIHLRRPHDVGLDTLFCLGVFNRELGPRRQTFSKNNHAAARADRVRKALNRVGFAGEMDQNGHAKQHALRAAPLLVGLRTNGGGAAFDLHAGHGLRCVRFLKRCQSSNPQKSKSGATSSTPYSQPSGC